MRRYFVLFTVFILSTGIALAAVPTQLTVQGRLTDAVGNPLAVGLKQLTFRIFDSQSGGTEIWPGGSGESQTLTSNAQGLWVALVGAIEPLTDAVFADSVRWLEITVYDGINPITTMPRVRLVTAPYAQRVATVVGAAGGRVHGPVYLDSTARFGDGPGPMTYIYESEAAPGPRAIAAYSTAFPDWGLFYEPTGDKLEMRSSVGTALSVGLGNLHVGVGTSDAHSHLTVGGSTASAVYTTTTSMVLDESHSIVLTNGSSITLTLPDAATCTGRLYTIKKIGGNFVHVNSAGGLIENVTDYYVAAPMEQSFDSFVSDGANWWLISR